MAADGALYISCESDVIHARMQVREMARRIGMEMGDQARISLATSSLANALGLGMDSISGKLDISRMEEGNKVALRVAIIFKNGMDVEWVAEKVRNIRWMLDSIDVQHLVNGYVEIAIIKWVTRGGADE